MTRRQRARLIALTFLSPQASDSGVGIGETTYRKPSAIYQVNLRAGPIPEEEQSEGVDYAETTLSTLGDLRLLFPRQTVIVFPPRLLGREQESESCP